MFSVKDKVKEFKTKYQSKCFALASWKNLKMKDYGITEMLTCICNAANGSLPEMAKIIEHLTSKNKVFGRTQVYNGNNVPTVDIVRDENGELVLKGYNPDAELPLKGQHQKRNSRIFRTKTDDRISKTFQNAEERMYNLGAKVREMFPGEDKQFITFAMKAIRSYAEQKKIHTDKVLKGLEKGRYKIDTDLWRVIPNVANESKRHIIVINESDVERVREMMDIDEHMFFVNMKNFIAQLLQDPVNAKVPSIFAQRGYTRSKLISYLLSGSDPILIRKQRISDKDENGNPKKATMMVRFQRNTDNGKDEYNCPKKNFDRKLQKLRISMLEKNLPPRKRKQTEEDVDEATGCGATGAAGGAFTTPVFPMIRREMPK